MTYEVELKFPLDDPQRILAELKTLQARSASSIEQRDIYFSHPQRDFAQTDEAFRLRCVNDQCRITYKGPVLDSQTKTRREIEIPLGNGSDIPGQFIQMMDILGFQPVRKVEKKRTPYRLRWERNDLEIVLDEVTDLGTFLEIELMAEEDGRDAARDSILRLAQRLNLSNPQHKSYLCLLLEKDRQ